MAPVVYKKQQQILDYIRQHIQSTGSAPTLREIAGAIGVSSLATVHEHLTSLEQKNLIKRKGGKNRTMEIVNADVNLGDVGLEVPILGFIAAGAPIEPFSDPNAQMSIPSSFV